MWFCVRTHRGRYDHSAEDNKMQGFHFKMSSFEKIFWLISFRRRMRFYSGFELRMFDKDERQCISWKSQEQLRQQHRLCTDKRWFPHSWQNRIPSKLVVTVSMRICFLDQFTVSKEWTVLSAESVTENSPEKKALFGTSNVAINAHRWQPARLIAPLIVRYFWMIRSLKPLKSLMIHSFSGGHKKPNRNSWAFHRSKTVQETLGRRLSSFNLIEAKSGGARANGIFL